MRRRDLLGLAIGAVVVNPFAARAQEPGRLYRIAYLGPSPQGSAAQVAFFAALGKLGFVEGKNLDADERGYGRRPGQFVEAAQELVQAKPDLILCGGPEAGRAAQQATKTIALLVNSDDLVGEGLVASIAHPGGNTSGVSIRSPDLDGKRFDILLELIPGARRLDALAGSDTANEQHFQALREAARARGVELLIRTAGAYGEIPLAVEAAKASSAAGLNVLGWAGLGSALLLRQSPGYLRADGGTRLACDLSVARERARRRPHRLRPEPRPHLPRSNVPAGGQGSARDEACGPAGRAPGQVRAGGQPQRCESAGADHASGDPRAGR